MRIATAALAGLSLLTPAASRAADLPPPPSALFDWTGGYLGVFLGGGSGTADFKDPFGPSIYGGGVTANLFEGGGQLGYNLQPTGSPFVYGVEVDGGGIGLQATNTCFATSSFVAPANCRVRGDAAATGTVRVGYAFGPQGMTLGYVTGGVAALFETRDAATTGALLPDHDQTASSEPLVGFMVGVGVEQALTPAWSIKLQYSYADYGRERIATPRTSMQTAPPLPVFAAVDRETTEVEQDSHTFKLGLNYRFGVGSSGLASLVPDPAIATSPEPGSHGLARFAPGWSGEFGGRYWYSRGRFQKDISTGLVGGNLPRNVLDSRLTYDTESSTGEVFGRIGSPYGVFLKGYAGVGGSTGGRVSDEDFAIPGGLLEGGVPLIVPYSNTLSSVRGNLGYATVDVGYDVLRHGASKIGAFVGYNHYRDDKNARGIDQTADPFFDINTPSDVLVLTERDTYDSVRIGLNGEIWFGQFRLQGDAAYLPYVGYRGEDVHALRIEEGDPISPQRGHGHGVQLELIASYDITPDFSVGAGGRYWSMSVPNATANEFGNDRPQYLPLTQQRYGTMVQAEYHF